VLSGQSKKNVLVAPNPPHPGSLTGLLSFTIRWPCTFSQSPMPNWKVKTVFVVGAGLSHYAGLPLTSKFTDALLEARDYKEGPSRTLVEFLSRFIRDAFGHTSTAKAKFWPALEDIFTCVDLSSNSGHHLGPNFAPADLRTVRRALLARTIRMLYQAYRDPNRRTPESAVLQTTLPQ
jgi:hypothetical protein